MLSIWNVPRVAISPHLRACTYKRLVLHCHVRDCILESLLKARNASLSRCTTPAFLLSRGGFGVLKRIEESVRHSSEGCRWAGISFLNGRTERSESLMPGPAALAFPWAGPLGWFSPRWAGFPRKTGTIERFVAQTSVVRAGYGNGSAGCDQFTRPAVWLGIAAKMTSRGGMACG